MKVHSPFLYQPWKHHLPFLQKKIHQAYEEGDKAAPVRDGLQRMGTSVTDLYTGCLSLEGLLKDLSRFLGTSLLEDENAFRNWLGEKGYRTLAISDGSEWTLKYAGGGDHWLHLHPARHGALSVRIRGETLRSAFLIVLASMRYGTDPFDKGLADQVREGYLGLGPVRELDQRKGLGRAIALLDPR